MGRFTGQRHTAQTPQITKIQQPEHKRIKQKSLFRDRRPYNSHLLEGLLQSSLNALKISRFKWLGIWVVWGVCAVDKEA